MTGYLWGLRSQAVLQLYLRRATWGLPPAQRQAVWDELEEHVLERAAHLEVQGTPPAEALDRVLRELGPPLRISAGMNGVYNMPKLVMLGTAATLAVSGALYALAGGAGGKTVTLSVLEDAPATRCVQIGKAALSLPVVSKDKYFTCYQDDTRRQRGAFVSLSTVQTALQAVGGSAEILPDGQMEMKLSDQLGDLVRGPVAFKTGGESYIPATSLLRTLVDLRHTQPMTISGFDRPALNLGNTVIRLSNGTVSVGREFYADLAGEVIKTLVYGRKLQGYEMAYDAVGDTPRAVHTGLPAGEVVVAVQREGKDSFRIAHGPVGTDGAARFKLGTGDLQFVASAGDLRPGQPGRSTPTLIVRVSNIPLNKLQSGVISPAQLRLLP